MKLTFDPMISPRVRPRAALSKNDPDEAFFIRTHQAFEIWFAQILAELEYARRLLSQPAPYYVPESDIPTISHHVRRAAAIFDLVRRHLPLLETLSTTGFYNFRGNLFGASGTQSYRYREVEWLIGLLDEDLLRYVKESRDRERKLSHERGKLRPTATEGVRPTGYLHHSEQEYESLARYQARWRDSWNERSLAFTDPDLQDLKHTGEALRLRMLDIQRHGTLREHAVAWLARTAFPAKRRGKPQLKHGELFSQNFLKAYRVAYANDASRLRNMRPMQPLELKQLEREATQRIRGFFREPHRRAIVFLVAVLRTTLVGLARITRGSFA